MLTLQTLDREQLAGLLADYGLRSGPAGGSLIDEATARSPRPLLADLPNRPGEIAITWDPGARTFDVTVSFDDLSYDLGEGVTPAPASDGARPPGAPGRRRGFPSAATASPS